MSGLVDIWTSEREPDKGRTASASGSSQDSSQVVQTEAERSFLPWPPTLASLLSRFNHSSWSYSEASLSMFIQCFSP
ncbi:hypothetical protein NMG60_11015356 [Bertholletia excelsa]